MTGEIEQIHRREVVSLKTKNKAFRVFSRVSSVCVFTSIKLMFVLCLICWSAVLKSQVTDIEYGTPPYYFFGQQELVDVDIYDVHLARDGVLYLATSNGFYTVKNTLVERQRPPEGQMGTSVFSITESPEGDIFFINLAGQLFQYCDKRIALIHEFSRQSVSNISHISCIGSGQIVFSSAKIIRYNYRTDESHTLKYQNSDMYGLEYRQTQIDDSTVVIPFVKEGLHLAILQPDQVQFKHIFETAKDWYAPKFVQTINGQFLTDKAGKIFDIKQNRYYSDLPENYRSIFNENQQVFGLGRTNGLAMLNLESQGLSVRDMLADVAISSMDIIQNTLILGTFGNGLIIIPEITLSSLFDDQFKESVGDFMIDRNGDIYLSTLEGSVFVKREEGLDTINIKTGYRQDNIFLMPFVNRSEENNYEYVYYNKQKNPAGREDIFGVRDAVQLSDDRVVFASYSGLSIFSKKPIRNKYLNEFPIYSDLFKKRYNHRYVFDNQILIKRGIAMSYDSSAKMIYYGGLSGVFRLDSNFDITALGYQNQVLQVSDIEYFGGKTYVSTKNKGLLVVEGQELLAPDQIQNHIESTYIRSLKTYRDYLFVLTEASIHVFDKKNKEVKRIGSLDGLPVRSIKKMDVYEDRIYALSKGRVYSFNWREFERKPLETEIFIDSVQIGSRRARTYQDMEISENEITVYAHFNNLLLHKDIKVQYRLVGREMDWQYWPENFEKVTLNFLQPGSYTFQIRLMYQGKVISQKEFSFEVLKPFYAQWWFLIAVGVFAILLVVVIYRMAIRRIRQKHAEKMKHQQLILDSVESKLKSLRSQMNPHFIFNSINSIQSLILSQDTEKSYDYVVMFADLVRQILTYSDEDFLTIEQEREFLGLYLELESLRMGDDFQWELEVNAPDNLKIPSLLVQPFVENSLHHGLMHQSGKKKLRITFNFNETLSCVIEDNGVGRKRAEELYASQNRHHSFSSSASRKRMEFFNKKYGSQANFRIEDLQNDAGEALGTRVHINLPFKL